MRYNKTERLGVIETERIITEELDWIFREQPIADVGIDAIIEEVIDDNPTGKFLAIQIKTGTGNFHINKNYLTYYVSNIHYHYWLNLCIPIILVAHFPEEKKTYWQEISESKLKRTNKQWKLDIPLNQELNHKSHPKLANLLSIKNDVNFRIFQGVSTEDEIFAETEDLICISESAKCLINMSGFMDDYTRKANELTEKIKHFTETYTPINSPQVTSAYRTFANGTLVVSKRLESEIEIFAELYATGIYAFEKIIIMIKSINLTIEDFEVDVNVIKSIPGLLEQSLIAIESLKQTVSEMITHHHHVKDSKRKYLQTLDLIYFETSEAKILTERIISHLNKS